MFFSNKERERGRDPLLLPRLTPLAINNAIAISLIGLPRVRSLCESPKKYFSQRNGHQYRRIIILGSNSIALTWVNKPKTRSGLSCLRLPLSAFSFFALCSLLVFSRSIEFHVCESENRSITTRGSVCLLHNSSGIICIHIFILESLTHARDSHRQPYAYGVDAGDTSASCEPLDSCALLILCWLSCLRWGHCGRRRRRWWWRGRKAS